MAAWLARLRQRPFRFLHLAWAALVLLVCVFLVLASLEGGHPPPLVFVPFTLVAGAFGHLVLVSLVSTRYALDSWTLVRTRPFEWSILAAIALAHLAALVHLLLRRDIVRWLLAAVSLGWAILLGRELETARGAGELILGIVIIAGLVALAGYLLRGPRVRAALC